MSIDMGINKTKRNNLLQILFYANSSNRKVFVGSYLSDLYFIRVNFEEKLFLYAQMCKVVLYRDCLY